MITKGVNRRRASLPRAPSLALCLPVWVAWVDFGFAIVRLARRRIVIEKSRRTPQATDAAETQFTQDDARGARIDLAALASALRMGRLGGAAIDVLPQEPPVDGSPLFAPDLPNLIVTPHVAWAARESRQRCIDEIAANVEDFLAGGRRGRVA